MQIYVTGIGIVSGIGINADENLDAIRNNKHGMGKVSLFPTTIDVPVCEVKYTNRQLQELLSLPEKRIYSRTTLLGMLAAKEALADSNLGINSQRIGFISSTSVGGMDLSEDFYTDFKRDNSKGKLRNIIHHDCGDSTEQIASYLNITDFVTTISTACSSAGNAVILGARMIKHGLLDAVVVGGTDALCKFTLNGFNSLMILDKEHCRPFDRSREGLNLGEGAGYLVLQSEKSLKRTPYCILSGYANANDAYHQTATSPEGNGPYLCMKEAIEMANISFKDIDYINVHGTGTPNNDLSEGKAITRIFGNKTPKFSSLKPFIGHTLGASEGIEAALSVLSVSKGLVYPNLNFKEPIEDTSLIPVTRWQEGLPIKHVLSNSFGFGGNDSSLLFFSNRQKMKKPCYINSYTSIHADGMTEIDGVLLAIEPDYKEIIPNANMRRRMSHIIKMGVACGLMCLEQNKNKTVDAIITATGLGCLADTEKFLNSLIENNEQLLNPSAFIQSTFNTIGAQIALLTENNSYNNTYVHRGLSFESALIDGLMKIWEGNGQVLVGAVDEALTTEYIIMKRLGMLNNIQLGEGSQFFTLSSLKEKNTPAELIAVKTFRGKLSSEKVIQKVSDLLQDNDLDIDQIQNLITGRNGNKADDIIYNHIEQLFPSASLSTFKNVCGEYPTASSFGMYQAINQLKEKENTEYSLIYNHYYNINHSLILLKKC